MRKFKLVQSKTEVITPHGGLAFIGHCINQMTSLHKTSRDVAKRHGIANIDLIRTYVGLVCLGKSDFEAVEQARHDPYFKAAMGIKQSPSSARLRQRFDEDAVNLLPLLSSASVEFLQNASIPLTELSTGHIPLDMDVFPMDNSDTKKEGVSYTYKGHDGYAPIAAYLGQQGWCLGCELRPGSQHANAEFINVLQRVIPRARQLTDQSLLIRLDSAHDALENRVFLNNQNVDFLIKWNPRKQDVWQWYDEACAHAKWHHPRPGKMEAVFSQQLDDAANTRRVVKVTVRHSDAKGQLFLEPEISLDGWLTSLSSDVADDATVIKLYKGHALCEQFHSEFKTDLDLERLPSGKFATNDLVMGFAVMAYNILRWIGLRGLMQSDSPVRHSAKRRRLKTVMQELMYLACRLVKSGRQLTLKFGSHCPGFSAFNRVYHIT